MKLYYSKGACSLAVRIVINELGLKCDYEAVDLKTKKTATGDDFLKINDAGAVPALALDDKKILTENIVIQQYLADTHKAYQLLPEVGNMKRYQILKWMSFAASDLHKSCSPLFNHALDNEVKQSIFIPA